MQKAVVQIDSTHLAARKFDMGRLASYHNQQEFHYLEDEGLNLSLWERIWRTVWNVINVLLQNKYTGNTVKYAVIFAVVGVLIFVTVRFSGLDLNRLSGRSKPIEIPYSSDTENIHEINFKEDISAAVSRGNYRLAVRLFYLSALKDLSDKKLIDWRPEKTNRTYVGELNELPYQEPFALLTAQFENIWYGQFPVGRAGFESLAADFERFNQYLK